MTIAERVRAKFRSLPEGGVIASKGLHRQLATDSQQVDKAASRLYKTEGLGKLRNGLFFRPYASEYFGNLPPREKDVIQCLRQQYGARIFPAGDLAAYELGLTHELPDTIVYETDKRIGPVRLESHTLHFRRVEGKKLATRPGGLLVVLNALEHLCNSEGGLSSLQRRHSVRLLHKWPEHQLQRALKHWPRWFQEQVRALMAVPGQRYITGLSAFNIPHQGKQADWHQMGMLSSHKFQIAGENYDSAPGLQPGDLFDCGGFLEQHRIRLSTTLCATPLRTIKDILYSHIIRKQQYPEFFRLDQFMLDVSDEAVLGVVDELKATASSEQRALLNQWVEANALDG